MSDPSGYQTPEQRLDAARSWAGHQPAPGGTAASIAPTEMTDRLHSVIAAAERAADAIRYDAEEQAHRHLAEARSKADRMTAERLRVIARLTDDLIEQATVVRQHSEQMVGSLERAIETVSGRLEEVTSAAAGPATAATPEASERTMVPPAPGATRSSGSLPPTPILDAALGNYERPQPDPGQAQSSPPDSGKPADPKP